jgi:hypothetical protein
MPISLFLRGLPLVIVAAVAAVAAEPDVAAFKQAQRRLRDAQAAGDLPAVRAAVDKMRAALGDQLGQPEGGEPKRVNADRFPAPTAAAARTYLEQFRARYAADVERNLADIRRPAQLSAGLRTLATLAIADARLAAAGEPAGDALRQEAVRAADALCSVQRENGLFPFPDIRQKSEFFGRMIRDLLARHPDALADGWIVSDGGSGDLQYDNGLCGEALLEVHALTGDAKYLAAARRSAAWVKTQPIVANWNYNAFSVGFLARLAFVTKDRAWLDEAVRRCRLGMLPGQMADGRWLDPHNAKLVYHTILGRALVELVVAGRALGAADAEIERATAAALANAADEILNRGVSVVTVPTQTIASALLRWRDDPTWHKALNALAAVGLARGAPESEMGLYAASYLEYAARR